MAQDANKLLDLASASYSAQEIDEALEFAKYSYFNHFDAKGMEAKLISVDAGMSAKISEEYDRLIRLLSTGQPAQEINQSFRDLTDLLAMAALKLN